jgi:hypothetical protein
MVLVCVLPVQHTPVSVCKRTCLSACTRRWCRGVVVCYLCVSVFRTSLDRISLDFCGIPVDIPVPAVTPRDAFSSSVTS